MITTSPWILAYAAGALVMFGFGVGMVTARRRPTTGDVLAAAGWSAVWPGVIVAALAS